MGNKPGTFQAPLNKTTRTPKKAVVSIFKPEIDLDWFYSWFIRCSRAGRSFEPVCPPQTKYCATCLALYNCDDTQDQVQNYYRLLIMTSILEEPQFSASSSTTAVALPNNGLVEATVAPRTLDRLVSELAERIQKATGAFFDVHKGLMLGKKPTRHSMDLFLEAKHAFRSEFEALRNILQSISRHSHYFETSCQRAPDDRYMSANRCQLSAKALLRDLQTGNEEYEKVLLSFKDQQISLFDLLNAKGQKIARQNSESAGTESDIVAKNPVVALYDALDGIQSSLDDVLSFWDTHVAFLKLLVNRQSNFPLPGDETKVTVELWVSYQNAILRSSSSILESVNALDVHPVMPISPKRTWGKGSYFSVHVGLVEPKVAAIDKPPAVETTKESVDHVSFSSRLGKLLHLF